METQIKKWGSRLAHRIPKSVARQLALEVDYPVGLTCGRDADDRPLERRLHLGDLLEQVSETNRHGEVQIGAPVGEEAWRDLPDGRLTRGDAVCGRRNQRDSCDSLTRP